MVQVTRATANTDSIPVISPSENILISGDLCQRFNSLRNKAGFLLPQCFLKHLLDIYEKHPSLTSCQSSDHNDRKSVKINKKRFQSKLIYEPVQKKIVRKENSSEILPSTSTEDDGLLAFQPQKPQSLTNQPTMSTISQNLLFDRTCSGTERVIESRIQSGSSSLSGRGSLSGTGSLTGRGSPSGRGGSSDSFRSAVRPSRRPDVDVKSCKIVLRRVELGKTCGMDAEEFQKYCVMVSLIHFL